MAMLSQAHPHLAVALAMERRGREHGPNRRHERLVGRRVFGPRLALGGPWGDAVRAAVSYTVERGTR